MKNIAILLCLLGFASSAFAAGTEIIMPEGGFQALDNPVMTESEYKESLRHGKKSKTMVEPQETKTYEKKVKFGSQNLNSPNAYWNHGRVNFGTGNFGNGAAGMNRW
ncbi:TPA: hypothetical protein IAC10_11545 [Candidatus Scatousia excrementigallinarum]|uniref:Uncharacterized protein n=1 Tax=Candidatus Scatousia excrementigallinarum TaxID=2840935 RepID=A0A9D1F0E2_9BACT|nr:hypothetical protein [Candidatus Scatousia excrementigallinarum]